MNFCQGGHSTEVLWRESFTTRMVWSVGKPFWNSVQPTASFCFVIKYHCVSGEPSVRSSMPTLHVMNEGHKLVPAHIPYVASHSLVESLLWPLYFTGHVHLSTKDCAVTDNQYRQNRHLFGKMQGKLHEMWTLNIYKECKQFLGRTTDFGFKSLWPSYGCRKFINVTESELRSVIREKTFKGIWKNLCWIPSGGRESLKTIGSIVFSVNHFWMPSTSCICIPRRPGEHTISMIKSQAETRCHILDLIYSVSMLFPFVAEVSRRSWWNSVT